MVPVVNRPMGPWRIAYAFAKLGARGALPGAYGYDLAAAAVRAAASAGVARADLLPLALPTSWMVNSKATSRVFRRWLTEPGLGVLRALVTRLADGTPWAERGAAERAEIQGGAALLLEAPAGAAANAQPGGGLAALSKVLALLCPETVPLLDDAAIWYALGALPCPTTADEPTAGAELFSPMLDWFAEASVATRAALAQPASRYPLAEIDAAQALDRLVWFESWGYRHSHPARSAAGATPSGTRERWWWVNAGERQAIVPLAGPHPAHGPEAAVDLELEPDGPWRDAAAAALETTFAGD